MEKTFRFSNSHADFQARDAKSVFGWRYSPRTPGDTSVTGWQLMALKSGQMASLSVPYECLKRADRYLDACEGQNKGGYGYVPGSGETPAC